MSMMSNWGMGGLNSFQSGTEQPERQTALNLKPNRTLGQAVPSTMLASQQGLNPNVPQAINNGGAPVSNPIAPSIGKPPSQETPLNFDFNQGQSPKTASFNYLGPQYDNLTMRSPGQSTPSKQPVGQNGGIGVSKDQAPQSPFKQMAEKFA